MKLPRPPFDLLGVATGLACLGLAALGCLYATGCAHVPKGGATAVHAEFGIPGVFNIKKDLGGVKVADKTVRVETASTDVQILLFVWHSSARDIVLSNPPPEKP